jgi:Ca-activated chloride channel homolog
MEFSFLYPGFLSFLLLVPFFVLVYFVSIAYNKKKAIVFANFEAMERFYDVEFFSKNFLALYLNLVILILLIFAVAGTAVSFEADTSAFSYVIAIDTSESMATEDVYPNRFLAAKTEAKRFVDMLPVGVEIGIVGFSGDSVVSQTLETSKIKVKSSIDNLEFGEVHGTNVYNALINANQLFGTRKLKAIVLMSDGQVNVVDAPQVIRYIGRNSLIVHTLAVGTSEGGVTEFDTLSKVDEDFMKSLAFNSGGEFFRIIDAQSFASSFEKLFEKINRQVTIDLSFYLLLAVIFLFTIMWILYNLRFKVVP